MVPRRMCDVYIGCLTKTVTCKPRSCALVGLCMQEWLLYILGPALEFAKIKLGLEEFKKHQTTAIRNFVEGHDLLVNLPTGFFLS